jgi:predicted AAA+ superfamily ATPase
MIKDYKPRPDYINRIRPFIGKEIIKVLVGHRRVGKSFLLYQLMDEIAKILPDADQVFINKELYDFRDIVDWEDLIEYIKKKKQVDRLCAVFIDEIQDIAEFQKALRNLIAEGGYDIYCTGSNARLLSGELATLLSGRYIEFRIYSLSYPEYLEFYGFSNSNETLFKYMRYGGMPYLIHLEQTDDVAYEYLKNIYHSIILKDLVERFKIRNVAMLERLVLYLADNVGSFTSANRISEYLKSQRIDLSVRVILDYLTWLTRAYLVTGIKRTGLKGRKIFENGEKYFFEDTGIRNSLIPFNQNDIQKLLENLVFNHLAVLGYSVSIGKLAEKEIDFVADRLNERIYVQVAYLLNSDQTRKREFGNLLEIGDNYPKYVVSMDEFASGNQQGIQHMHIRDFLTRKSFVG